MGGSGKVTHTSTATSTPPTTSSGVTAPHRASQTSSSQATASGWTARCRAGRVDPSRRVRMTGLTGAPR